MKKESRRIFCTAVCLLVLFVLWTILVCVVDVKPIGPQNSAVGFSSLNGFFHSLTGVHMSLYAVTDWLSLIPIGIMASFALLGLKQWIERKSILKVDFSILALGVFYAAVFAVYILFEELAVNFRPVLINGILEASYPSSTTVLVLCVMPTAAVQFNERIKNAKTKRAVNLFVMCFTVFMAAGRLVSGVHWLTDIIGGILLGAGLAEMYYAVINIKK